MTTGARVLLLNILAVLCMGALGSLAMFTALVREGGWAGAILDDDLILLPICFVIGCIVGIFSLPIVSFMLCRTQLRCALPIVYGMAGVVTIAYAMHSNATFYPLDCAVPAFVCVCMMSMMARAACPKVKEDQRVLCEHCGYNLHANTSGICPECGTTVTRDRDSPSRSTRDQT